jgi:chaperone required for assembly of F1-ATPase
MKRFYKMVTSRPHAEGHIILLDGKPVKTPARADLVAPSESVARQLVLEWAGQGETILPDTMPLTQLLSTKIDRVLRERPAMTAAVLKYLDTDLVCYRACQPPELSRLHAGAWDPALDWFEKKFGEKLETTTALKALVQPPEAHKKVSARVQALDDNEFTILQIVTSLSGSLVLALAFVAGDMGAEQVFAAANVEETYKAGLYKEDIHGPDPMQEKKQAAMQADLKAAENFLALLRKNM